MSRKYRLLGISGSLRSCSYSSAILHALAERGSDICDAQFASIEDLPHYNQDLAGDRYPVAVQRFEAQIAAADGLLIVSPEYNHGMPGVLKNALDWASRPHNGSVLKDKPVLVVTSSVAVTGGVRAQYQLRETLFAALARPTVTPKIVIGSVSSKMENGQFKDDASLEFAIAGLRAMIDPHVIQR